MQHTKKHLLSSGLFLISFLIVFGVFIEKLRFHKLLGFDMKLIGKVQERIDNPNTRLMKCFTFLGSPLMVSMFVACSVMIFYRFGKRRAATGMLIANAAGVGFNEGLKYLFRRRRPDIHRLVPAHGYSFPSGHAMGSVMFYGTLSYWLCRQFKSISLKVLTCTISGIMVVMTGVSRIYLGVHFPSDVLSGYAAGASWLSASIKGFNAILAKEERS